MTPEELEKLRRRNWRSISRGGVTCPMCGGDGDLAEAPADHLAALQAQVRQLQPYLMHQADCRLWTRGCAVVIPSPDGGICGMRTPTHEEIEAVPCTCGLAALLPSEPK